MTQSYRTRDAGGLTVVSSLKDCQLLLNIKLPFCKQRFSCHPELDSGSILLINIFKKFSIDTAYQAMISEELILNQVQDDKIG